MWTSLFLAAVCVLLGNEPDRKPAKLSRAFAYIHDEVASEPWSIHIVKIDRSYKQLELHSAFGKDGRIGLSPLSEQAVSLPKSLGRPLAAINGDYYRDEGAYAGDPKGLLITRGELISAPCGWTCFWVDTDGNPQITNILSRFEVSLPGGQTLPFGLNEERPKNGVVLYTSAVGASTKTKNSVDLILEPAGEGPWLPLRAGEVYRARVKEVDPDGNAPLTAETMVLSVGPQAGVDTLQPGAPVSFSTATIPDMKGVITALNGGPALVRDGAAMQREEVRVRNPRSAIGWNSEHFFLVQVDGRQRNLSVGMTTDELADYMVKIGCDSAMSLDGGGSATFWVYGQIMNSPSEGFERPMANSLVVVQSDQKEDSN